MEKKIIYTSYNNMLDITVIFEDTEINGKITATEVKGFYFGKPSEEDTKKFYGKLKAEYTL